jgi:hypothetical protein
MTHKYCSVILLVLWGAACSHQAKQQKSAGATGAQTAATAAPAPLPPADATPSTVGNPEPVERPPVEAVVSPEPSAAAPPPAPAAAPALAPAPPPPVARPAFPARTLAGDHAVAAEAIIPAGTHIRVRLGQTLDSKRSRPGDRFVAYLADPVVSGGRVIVPRGTEFEGRVVEARRGSRLKGRAYLGVRLDSFRLHGRTYQIATAADIRASSSHKKRNVEIIGGSAGTGATVGAVAGGGIGAAVGAGAGAFVGTAGAFITGRKDVKLPVETPLVFSLRGAVAVHG